VASMRDGFVRTANGFEIWLDPSIALAMRRCAREVQELIASEPAVEGLAGVGPDEENVTDEVGGFSDLQGMLASGTLAGLAGLGGEVPPLSDDPALARLFPAAYEDAEAAEEYRRFTYAELHAAKISGLELLSVQLGAAPEIVLDEESAGIWLSALNDIRLVLGTQIGIEEDNAEEFEALAPADPRALAYGLYVVLTMVQESLVEALAGW
jgi:hypothetical protein